MISKIITQQNMLSFLEEFYGLEKESLFNYNSNGHYVLRNFHYTGWIDVDESADEERIKYFYLLIDEEKKDIVAIIKYATQLVDYELKDYQYFGGCMYYLEINPLYQKKHLLKTVVAEFAEIYGGHIFVSNHESTKGSTAHVNDHLKSAFETEGLIFYENDIAFLKEINRCRKDRYVEEN